jgi:hypothetical protein
VLERRSATASLRAVTYEAEGSGLDERERAILDFERESWKLTMSKERAIRERFGFSAARYHQLLNRTVDRTEALSYDPMLVRRLRRVREDRRKRRVADRLGVRY